MATMFFELHNAIEIERIMKIQNILFCKVLSTVFIPPSPSIFNIQMPKSATQRILKNSIVHIKHISQGYIDLERSIYA